MEELEYQAIKAALNAELDAISEPRRVGIMLGSDIYREMARRRLFAVLTDPLAGPWRGAFTYREALIHEGDKMPENAFIVGKPLPIYGDTAPAA